jgi:hypothetical protein
MRSLTGSARICRYSSGIQRRQRFVMEGQDGLKDAVLFF